MFLGLKPYKEIQKVNQLRRCFNCLSVTHTVDTCKVSINNDSNNSELVKNNTKVNNNKPCSELSIAGISSLTRVLLSTAMVKVKDFCGEYQSCRALIDPGSEGSFISQNCYQRLVLPQWPINVSVHGVGNSHAGYTRGTNKTKVFKLNHMLRTS